MSTLAYWNTRGLAQPIRLLLNYVGEDFKDVRYELGDGPDYSTEQWRSVKYKLGLPCPNLPYYINGDIKVTQSNAILRHIGRKYNMLGDTESEKVNVDIMLEQAMDFRNNLMKLVYNPDFEKIKTDYLKKLPGALETFQNFLGDNPWFAGQKITVCDFHIYELLDQHRIMEPGCLDKYQKLTEFMDRFEALPNIKAYLASDECIKRPINNKFAPFK
ncbi:hypothetical protein KUTeg_020650 [Tegillarca granosa]|uniref:glutathione transferase n=1 Tax=Tegillarca granosa TaxID=220873 RepID=A0ABQ9EEI4_TEGGR|nr:hypothetical protein KUTeg_020650 [Tegillarca granosa]